jgi:histidinol phosphatase-like PHP family hydrolase
VSLNPSQKLSFDEKKQAVRNFIVASYHRQAHIKTYHRLAMFLDGGRIKLLRSLSKSGKKEYLKGSNWVIEEWFTDDDAEEYFEWLIAVVNETVDVREEVVEQAFNQLFRFLYVMREDIERDKNVELIAPYDWMTLFAGWDKVLVKMKNSLEHRDEEIVDILKSILLLLKQNRTFLETMQKDYERFIPKDDVP